MKKLLLLLLLCSFGTWTSAQDAVGFKGTVLDSTGAALPYATVAALDPADSTMVGFGITNDEGFFKVDLDAPGTYLVKIVLVGYANFEDKVELTTEAPFKDYGDIPMYDELLNTLDITAEHIPVLIKEDTVEYNAAAFKTDPNAPVEDLLRKLPGVEVDKDGNIKAQGEDITKVYVDGKEFFGDDPKVATKNLPADAVKKVQVYDKKSETSDFTGVDDGTTSKTINIELKDNKKNGAFGKFLAGYGAPDNRFKLKGNYNKFNKKSQLSLIGMGNNTSEDGFSWEDYVSFMGGAKKLFKGGGGGFRFNSDNMGMNISNGMGDGLITTGSGGVNFNHEFSKKSKLNISYFAYRANTLLNQTQIRNNILDTTTYTTLDSSDENTIQWTHRVSFRYDLEIDSMREITLRGNGSYATDDFSSSYNNITLSEEDATLNSGNRTSGYDGFNYSGDLSLIFRNKFKKEGRNFVVELNGGLGSEDYSGYLNNISQFAIGGMTAYDTLNQNIINFGDNYNWSGEVTYTEPLGKSRFLMLSASHGEDVNDNKYFVFDNSNEVSSVSTFNLPLSSNFNRGYSYTQTGAAFRWIKGNWNFNPGVNAKWSYLEGADLYQDSVDFSVFNVLPYLSLRFKPSQTSRWRIRYNTDVNIPTLIQLQTRVDNSDPFNIVTGNPNLRPEYQHSFSLNGGKFNQFSMSGFYGGGNFGYTKDKIQYATTITPQFVQISSPINVDRDISSFVYAGYYTPFKLGKLKMKMSTHFNGGASRGYFLVNDVEDATNSQNGSLTLTVENSKKSKVDIAVGGTFSGTQTTYDNSTYSDQVFTTITGYIDAKFNIKENWIFRTSYDHSQYSSQAFDQVTVIPLLKASISTYVLKKQGELKFEAFDIFNQNRGISRTANLNYLQETKTNSIGRYFMVSFTYSLQKLGKEKGFMMTSHRRR